MRADFPTLCFNVQWMRPSCSLVEIDSSSADGTSTRHTKFFASAGSWSLSSVRICNQGLTATGSTALAPENERVLQGKVALKAEARLYLGEKEGEAPYNMGNIIGQDSLFTVEYGGETRETRQPEFGEDMEVEPIEISKTAVTCPTKQTPRDPGKRGRQDTYDCRSGEACTRGSRTGPTLESSVVAFFP
ncbi:hypothetical protein LX32DRAFT_651772 [Colletotrichum zoysiae]|uniref:Uncharacterized protein n=1 Tax=Colletotrichum zoysiae TaxID=1216348 RepID=A0AAD9HKQ3_9PEZI|nr:hypothetical protein LX32DRAFT_651772 [Colletotrichum zoysiae]